MGGGGAEALVECRSAAELVATSKRAVVVGTHSRVGELGGRDTKNLHHQAAGGSIETGCQLGEASQ